LSGERVDADTINEASLHLDRTDGFL